MKKTNWAKLLGITDQKLAEAFNDWMQCMRDHEDRYNAAVSKMQPLLGLIPKKGTK